MQQQIKRLVEEGGEEVHYHKAVDCLKALRAGCLESYDEESFNTFIKGLKTSYEKTVRCDRDGGGRTVSCAAALTLCTL